MAQWVKAFAVQPELDPLDPHGRRKITDSHKLSTDKALEQKRKEPFFK